MFVFHIAILGTEVLTLQFGKPSVSEYVDLSSDVRPADEDEELSTDMVDSSPYTPDQDKRGRVGFIR